METKCQPTLADQLQAFLPVLRDAREDELRAISGISDPDDRKALLRCVRLNATGRVRQEVKALLEARRWPRSLAAEIRKLGDEWRKPIPADRTEPIRAGLRSLTVAELRQAVQEYERIRTADHRLFIRRHYPDTPPPSLLRPGNDFRLWRRDARRQPTLLSAGKHALVEHLLRYLPRWLGERLDPGRDDEPADAA
jgi:hypothetical protein